MLHNMFITIHYMDWSRSDTDVVARLKELKRLFSAVSLKVDCSWRFVETADGKLDFSWPDRICKLSAQAGLQVWFILNSAWGMPEWVRQAIGDEAFAWNSLNNTGRQGVSAGSQIGKYPMPVIPAYSHPWMLPRISYWQHAVVEHVEKYFPKTIAGYIAEGEIYLNPDNDLGDCVFDYNPHTISMFRKWLGDDPSSPYHGASKPDELPQVGLPSLNTAWGVSLGSWDDVTPPRRAVYGSIAWRDWSMFLRWYVSWSYQQITRTLKSITRKPVSLLVNSFTGLPMPDDHVWGGHRTHNNAWSIYQAVAPYVDYLGLTAYEYDPDWEIDRSAQWCCNMAYMDGCTQWLIRPAWIVEGGSIMRPRCLNDLRWQLYNAYHHGHPGVVLGYLDMASGQNANYSWNPAVSFPATASICKAASRRSVASPPKAQVAVIYNSLSELLAPGDGTEARAVRACVRWLRSVGVVCHVIDTLAIEQHIARLDVYKLVIMPCVHALSLSMQKTMVATQVPIYSDAGAGSTDEWMRPGKPIITAGTISSTTLNAEQADLEDRGIRPAQPPAWLRDIGKYVDVPLHDPRVIVAQEGRLVFNRDPEMSVRYKGKDIPPGSEYPSSYADQATKSMNLAHELILTPEPDGRSGPCEIRLLKMPDASLVLDCAAYAGPSGYWQAAVYWNIAAGSLGKLARFRFSYQVVPSADQSIQGVADVELRLSSSTNGRIYAVKLPVYASSMPRDVTVSDLGLTSSQRRAEIDHVEVCFSGSNWAPIKVVLSKILLFS